MALMTMICSTTPPCLRMNLIRLTSWLPITRPRSFLELCPPIWVIAGAWKNITLPPAFLARTQRSTSSIQNISGSNPPMVSTRPREKSIAAPETNPGSRSL